MRELKSNKSFRPPSPVKDAKGLSALVGMLNAHVGVTAPKEISPAPAAEVVKAAPAIERPTPQPPAASLAPAAAPAPVINLNRVFMTGRLKSGKDYCLAQAGFNIHALADPLYFLAEYFFGQQPKDATRGFLQAAGNWGRGLVSAAYPLTPERACFIETVCSLSKDWTEGPAASLGVDWSSYGRNENIWLDALVARVNAEPAEARVAVSGVRFSNEVTRLTAENFVHFHCLCSPATWAARLKQVGLAPESPATKDVSEYLAASLDQNVTKTLSQQRQGNKLRAVWSDPNVPTPSGRLLTLAEFCAMFKT